LSENIPEENQKRVYRDISQKYCSRIDDNVIIVREVGKQIGGYECLSSHLCGGNAQCSINRQNDTESTAPHKKKYRNP